MAFFLILMKKIFLEKKKIKKMKIALLNSVYIMEIHNALKGTKSYGLSKKMKGVTRVFSHFWNVLFL